MQIYLTKETVIQKSQDQETRKKDTNNKEAITRKSVAKSRVSVQQNSPRPPRTNNKRQSAKQVTRVELRLNLQATVQDKGNVDQLQRQLQQLITKLLEVDDSVQIHPWYDTDTEKTMKDNKVPTELRSIHQFFPRV
jgi:uncharacterized coiled-coil protein SlyX